MAVGGFNGTDPAPTLEQFQALVAAKKIHYFVGGGTAMGGRGGVHRHRRQRRRHPDRAVGAGELRGHDRRRHDRLRPDRDRSARRRSRARPRPTGPDAQLAHRFDHNDRDSAADRPWST